MVIKSVEAQRPQAQVARVERSKLPAIEATLAQPLAEPPKAVPDSAFAGAKKKLVNTTGRHKPVALPLNAALPTISAGTLRGSPNAIEAALRGPPRGSAQPGLLAFKGEVAQAQGVGGTAKAFKAKLDPAITDFLKTAVGVDDAAAKADFKKLAKEMNAGEWTKAAATAHASFEHSTDDARTETLDNSLGLEPSRTVEQQLQFLSKMSGAGIKADYPPTQDQLKAYFKTLSTDPKAARAAFEAYTKAFHVHPAVANNDPKADVEYGRDSIGATPPKSWADVEQRDADPSGKHLAKNVNDCEGYALMAQELMGAAGFTFKEHLTANGGPAGAHAMVAFTHPKEPGAFTVTSNGGTFSGKNLKSAADQGFLFAGGKTTKGTSYYAGESMRESQLNAGSKKHAIK